MSRSTWLSVRQLREVLGEYRGQPSRTFVLTSVFVVTIDADLAAAMSSGEPAGHFLVRTDRELLGPAVTASE
jgi:hypothetical protein